MAPWIILMFSLYGLHGQAHYVGHAELQPPSLQECCQDGRNRTRQGHDCIIFPLISSSHICRIAQEQCCAARVRDTLCTNGINMARNQGACERPFFQGEPWETQVSKMCCDCCMLGLSAAAQGLSCELEGLLLGRLCVHAANTCCGKNTTEETKPPTQEPVSEKPSTSVTAKPVEGIHNCRDSICSQLCVGNGTCACRDGYQLKEDGVNCDDVNECLTGSHNCLPGQVCINTEGSFRCQRETSCGTGYELTDHNNCQDINECDLGTHNCGKNFACTNTAGSFRCHPWESCGNGYFQDAVGSCIDINECVAHTSPCLPGQTCINTVGSYTCQRNTITCGRGYHLTKDGTRCEDVDECRVGHVSVCGGHGCVNMVGTYRCECQNGFIFNSITKLCEDVNECRHYPGRLCAHKCENTAGSYQCSCSRGFKLSHDGRNCEDVDECEAKPCSQECANVYGSYHCYCRRGYQLSDIDGITCEDIDECALPTGGHVCSYRCSNTLGSFYCTCPPTGYTLAPDRHTCQDIDECAAGSHTCAVFESCFNVQGGFRCLPLECPTNFRRAAEGTEGSGSARCIKVCQPNDIGCAVDPVHLITHTVLSLPTFREFTAPEEIVFLRTTVPAKSTPLPSAIDVFFDIVAADDELSFDVVKHSYHDLIMGTVRQVKHIVGPRDLMVEVAMNYFKSEVFSHRTIVVIHVFISEFWF